MINHIGAEGDYLICPYCGAKIRINPDIFSDNIMDDEAEEYCKECNRSFYVTREVTLNYYSVGKLMYVKE